MKKLLILIILIISITAGVKTAYSQTATSSVNTTGQTNITIKQYPQIGVSSTIPATFGNVMNNNIIPIVKNEILPFSFLMFLFAMAIRLYLNEEKGYMKEIFYMIFIISILVMYNTLFLWLNAVCDGIAHAIMPSSEVALFIKSVYNWKHPVISIWSALSIGGITATAASIISGIAMWIIEWLRYILLSFLYLIGPITISLSIIPPLRPFLKAWIKDTIEVMSWLIVSATLFQVFNTVLSTGNTYPSLQNLDPLAVAAIYTLLLVLIILTPYLTSKLYQGGMGALGSIASYAATTIITSGASAGLGAAGVGGGGLAGSLGAKMAGSGGTAGVNASSTAARRAAEAAMSRKSNPYRKRGSDE